ncbi:ABC transporter permease [Umezawaea beigongshangensis]|uniref:ABC transporter permease n=1 Tax=Umezawaea beigongshangensis TaxID=2780383 RepID=UPI0018F13A0E|nr:ABC transporter permease [Umezawaea beigongshangensis]
MSVTTDFRLDAPVRPRVTWSDLLWLTWRQHRWTISLTAFGAAGLMGAMAVSAVLLRRAPELLQQPWTVLLWPNALLSLPWVLGLLVGVFWGAPLLAREYEQRTNLLVWSQDLPMWRWVFGKAALLCVVLASLGLALGCVSSALVAHVNELSTYPSTVGLFDPDGFENSPLLQPVYAVFGFALGLAVSAVTRRSMVAVAVTFVLYGVVRVGVVLFVRPSWWTPLRVYEPVHEDSRFYATNANDLMVGYGHADAAKVDVEVPRVCYSETYSDSGGYARCLDDHGIVWTVIEYQPLVRRTAFQFAEFGLFLALTAALFALTWWWMRRSDRV